MMGAALFVPLQDSICVRKPSDGTSGKCNLASLKDIWQSSKRWPKCPWAKRPV